MFSPIVKGVRLAASPKGRRVIRGAVVLAQTPQGRKMLAEARRMATSPESRRLANQVVQATTKAGKTAAGSENRDRLKEAVRNLRSKRGS
jgi:hypothetical protein